MESYTALSLYKSWGEREGCVRAKVDIVLIDEVWGCGAWALQDLPAGEDVLSVPFRLLINHQNVMKTSPFSDIAADLEKLDPLWVIYLFLIHGRADPTSFWRYYFDILPTQYSTPLWWDDQALEEIKGCNLHDQAAQIKAALKRIYDEVLPPLAEKHPSIFKPEVFTWESFLWAYSAFWSRCFACNKSGTVVPTMAPICDAANHDDKASVLFYYNAEDDTFRFKMENPAPANSQFFINYKTSCTTSESQLKNYGFISNDITMDTDTCWVQLGLKQGDEALDIKIKLLGENEIPQRHHLTSTSLPASLIQAMRICLIDDDDVYFYAHLCNGKQRISLHNEIQVYETLLKMLQAKLQGFSDTEEQDIAKFTSLTGKAPTISYVSGSCNTASAYHHSLALWHKLSQRHILKHSIVLVQKELGSILPQSQLGAQPITEYWQDKVPGVKTCNLQLSLIQNTPTPVAKKDLNVNDPIFTCNSRLLISQQLISKTKVGKAVAWAQQRKKLANKEIDWEDMATCLYLIQEKHNPQSTWVTFFKSLPSEFHNTLCWTDEDLDELDETLLLEQTLHLKAQLKSDFSAVLPVLSEKFPDIFPVDKFTFENYMWAFTLCETRRIVTPDCGAAVIPLPALLPHHPSITVQKTFDTTNKTFEMRTHQAIPGHHVVYDSYGKLPNQQLLLIHGICLDENPYETLDIDFDVAEHDPLRNDKIALLQKLKLQLSNKLGMNQLSPFMPYVCIASNALELKELDVDLVASPFKAAPSFEINVLNTLAANFQSLVSQELMADDASPHAILAWKYRCGQNNVLHKNIEFITKAIKELQ